MHRLAAALSQTSSTPRVIKSPPFTQLLTLKTDFLDWDQHWHSAAFCQVLLSSWGWLCWSWLNMSCHGDLARMANLCSTRVVQGISSTAGGELEDTNLQGKPARGPGSIRKCPLLHFVNRNMFTGSCIQRGGRGRESTPGDLANSISEAWAFLWHSLEREISQGPSFQVCGDAITCESSFH